MANLVVKKDAWTGTNTGVPEPLSRTCFPLIKDETVIGRRLPADIVLPAGYVSTTEVKVVRDGDSFYLENMQSRNATWFKGQRMRFSPRQLLNHGDEIEIGDYLLVFLEGDEPLTHE